MQFLREMIEEDVKIIKLNEGFARMEARFQKLLGKVKKQLEEGILDAAPSNVKQNVRGVHGDLDTRLAEVERRFAAVRKALSIVNKMSAGPEKQAHARRIMANMNHIRKFLQELQLAMAEREGVHAVQGASEEPVTAR